MVQYANILSKNRRLEGIKILIKSTVVADVSRRTGSSGRDNVDI